MQLNNANKVFRITDLVKMIGDLKHSFESASDIKKLNDSDLFQDLVCGVFGCEHDCEIFNRNGNEDRIHITICKHNDPIFIVTCMVYKKYKRKPFHIEMIFMSNSCLPVYNQRQLAKWILNDCIIFQRKLNHSSSLVIAPNLYQDISIVLDINVIK